MYIFAGGGTGGHLTPGLAVAESLRQIEPAATMVFVGTDRPVERRLIPPVYEHQDLPVESSQSLWRNPVRFLWNNSRAYRIAASRLRAKRPDAVIGLGGFASVPVVLAAARLRIPTILLEQNVVPGRATRWLSRFADCLCVSFPETVPLFRRGNVVATGNPVRREIANLTQDLSAVSPAEEAVSLTLLVLGGSQGAQSINAAMVHLAETGQLKDWRVVHQTGAGDDVRVAEAYAKCDVAHEVAPFIDDMAARYKQATLIISRAGATTLAEIACAGCPSILVPYPHATRNHQVRNAEVFANAGAAEIVAEKESPQATAKSLAAALDRFRIDSARQAAREAARRLARPQAAEQVAQIVLRAAGRAAASPAPYEGGGRGGGPQAD